MDTKQSTHRWSVYIFAFCPFSFPKEKRFCFYFLTFVTSPSIDDDGVDDAPAAAADDDNDNDDDFDDNDDDDNNDDDNGDEDDDTVQH